MSLRVLYEDNHLIAVYKPAGVLVQADDTKDATLLDEVKYYLKQKYHKTGKVFLGLIHRLDRPVSGVILFAKTSKGASRLSEQIRNHEVTKVYQALVEGKPAKEAAILVNWISKNENTNKVKVLDQADAEALRAELYYKIITTDGKRSILEINLKTGRPHQIRSQLAHLGHPIVGDIKYGAKAPLPDQSIALCAVSFTFRTATGDEIKTAAVEPPFTL
ncbi:MAG: RNA pseudouridine synthase [bacterium]|nr:RNA pseudouridine synthase [bacterium]